MSKRKQVIKPDLSPGESWAVRICLALSLVISAFLLWNSLRGGAVPGCGPESDCDKVLTSRWAYIFGIPVSAFALPVYAALLALLFKKVIRWTLVLPLAILILLAAIWFIALQAFSLRAFCKFCMTAHAAGLFAALLLLKCSSLSGPAVLRSAAISVAALAVLVALQFATPPRAPAEIHNRHSEGIVAGNANAARGAHTITIVEGQFTLDLDKLPLTGSPDAPKKMVKLFDYSCHHCRDLHHLLEAFRKQHPNQIAVISLPVPLNSDCNPLVKRTPKDHIHACDYARIGLAVFLANPAKFSEFSDWVFAPDRPPSVSETQSYAESLVGARELREALNSPAIGEQLSSDINIYATSSRLARSSQLPQMLFEEGGSIGSVNTPEQLAGIMSNYLGIASAPAH